MAESPPVVALFGATALGKSDVADSLAATLGAEIVVADSMQVYRGLPILTNQPDPGPPAVGSGVRHLVGLIEPQREFSVAEYGELAHRAIDGALARRRAVIVEGGSGLYLRAALGDLSYAAAPDPRLRGALEERWARDRQGVLAELRSADPATFARLDQANGRRVVRALEAVLLSGAPLPEAAYARLWRTPERYAHRLFVLRPNEDRTALSARIDARVDGMLARGALEEVRRARRAGAFSRTASQAIGVRELCAVLDGELTLVEARACMKTRTRALARRQLTWMRRIPDATAVLASGRSPSAVAAGIADVLRTSAW